jgi:arylsulfate sulfotransferase
MKKMFILGGICLVFLAGCGKDRDTGNGNLPPDTLNIPDDSIPGMVTLTSPADNAAGVIVTPTLLWSPGSGSSPSKYSVKVSTNVSFDATVVNDSVTSSSYVISSALNYLTTYYWEINAVNASGASAYKVDSFTTIDDPIPGMVTLTNPADNAAGVIVTPTLLWSPGSGGSPSKYSVKVSTNVSFDTTVVNDSVTSTSYVISSALNHLTTYYWEINAVNASGASAYKVDSFTTIIATLNIPDDSIILNPYGTAPLSALAKYESSIPGRTRISVTGKNGPGSNAEHLSDDYGLTHSVPIAGLYANYDNTVTITLIDSTGTARAQAIKHVTTDPLPAGLTRQNIVTTRQGDNMEDGFNLVSNMSTAPNKPFFVDNFGDIRWLLDFSNDAALSRLTYDCGIDRLRNGNYYFGDVSSTSIYEVDILGKIIHRWILSGYSFHHNVYEKPDGNFLISVSKTGSTRPNGAATVEDYIIEIDRQNGSIVTEWDLKKSLDIYRTALTTNVNDWVHVNAVIFDSSDNTIIVSGRTQGVVKLTYNNTVQWILSPHKGWGVNGNGDSLQRFLLTPLDAAGNVITDTAVLSGSSNHTDFEWNWYQHSPVIMPNQHLLLFDNGSSRNFNTTNTNLYSRAVEYAINAADMTVRQVWSYGKERGRETFSNVISKVQYLPNTNHVLFCPGFINYNGIPGKIVEIDYPTKQVVFEMNVCVAFHRAKRLVLYP